MGRVAEEAPGGAREEKAGGSKVRGGREVTWVVTNPAACVDGGSGRDVRRKAHSRREAPTRNS